MPVVDFLTDDEAAAYGRFVGPPSQADLERVFFLDDEDRALVGRRRGEHMKNVYGRFYLDMDTRLDLSAA